MRKAVIFLLIFCPLWAVSQRMHAHTVVDEHRKFTYTATGGVTTSYVGYFGDRFVPGQFTTLDGEAINPADSAGCVFVYNFWFTACAPCVAEIPALNRVVEKFAGRRVYFVGIGWDAAPRLKAFLERRPYRFQIVSMSRDSIQALKKVDLYPFTLVADASGRVSFVVFGRPAVEDQEAIFGQLEAAVNKAINQ